MLERQLVIVTFIAAPPDMGRTVRALLMDAEYPWNRCHNPPTPTTRFKKERSGAESWFVNEEDGRYEGVQ